MHIMLSDNHDLYVGRKNKLNQRNLEIICITKYETCSNLSLSLSYYSDCGIQIPTEASVLHVPEGCRTTMSEQMFLNSKKKFKNHKAHTSEN